MARYRFVALAPDGEQIKGKMAAENVRGAMTDLLERELEVVELKERKSILQFELTRKKLPLWEVMHFSRQLAAFMRAGVPLVDALSVIESEAEKDLRKVLAGLREELQAGGSFSTALTPYRSMFPQFFVDMVRAAEYTGTLDTVLDEMSRYIERDLEARNKIKSAIMYPAVIVVAAIITVVVLSAYVLPRFKVFFESFNATLPLPTRILISMTDWLSAWWWGMVFAIILSIVVIALVFRTKRGRRFRDRWLLRLPLAGDILRFSIIERFCRLLAAMVDAGVPLPQAMGVLAQGSGNAIFQHGLSEVREAMLRGEGLAQPMGATRFFPGAVIQMVRVGENTGTLDAQLGSASDYYGRELEYKIKRLTAMFEPAVIVFMGVIVGFVAIALISAMYGIYRQIQVP